MEKRSDLDMAVDILKERLADAGKIMHEKYKNTRPFRQPAVPDREKLYRYEQIAPEVKMQYYQQYPVRFARIEQEMAQLRRKYYES